MRTRSPDLKAVIISGLPDAAATATELDNVVFLGKPFDLSTLVDIVNGALSNTEPPNGNN